MQKEYELAQMYFLPGKNSTKNAYLSSGGDYDNYNMAAADDNDDDVPLHSLFGMAGE